WIPAFAGMTSGEIWNTHNRDVVLWSRAMFDLTGRTALITGAAGGIGRAIATVLSAAGAKTVLTGTREAALGGLSRSLGRDSRALVADLADPGQVLRLAQASGDVDILINNAGIAHREPTGTTPDVAWDRLMEINLSAVFRLSRALLPGMGERKWGRV